MCKRMQISVQRDVQCINHGLGVLSEITKEIWKMENIRVSKIGPRQRVSFGFEPRIPRFRNSVCSHCATAFLAAEIIFCICEC